VEFLDYFWCCGVQKGGYSFWTGGSKNPIYSLSNTIRIHNLIKYGEKIRRTRLRSSTTFFSEICSKILIKFIDFFCCFLIFINQQKFSFENCLGVFQFSHFSIFTTHHDMIIYNIIKI
jgi:hypothetical protein